MTAPYVERRRTACDCDFCRLDETLPLWPETFWSAPLEPVRAVVDLVPAGEYL